MQCVGAHVCMRSVCMMRTHTWPNIGHPCRTLEAAHVKSLSDASIPVHCLHVMITEGSNVPNRQAGEPWSHAATARLVARPVHVQTCIRQCNTLALCDLYTCKRPQAAERWVAWQSSRSIANHGLKSTHAVVVRMPPRAKVCTPCQSVHATLVRLALMLWWCAPSTWT